jgi:hypothetical protein
VGELLVAELAPRLAEGEGRVLRLTARHDVADEAKEVALARRVREVAPDAERLAEQLLAGPELGADLLLVGLEHALVLAHRGDVLAAEVAEALILGLPFVVFEVLQERLMLHHRVVDLALQKVSTPVHFSLR